MKSNTKDLQRDIEKISHAEFIPWDALQGKTFFVTGATGLIGYNFVCALLHANRTRKLHLNVIALVRDLARAKARFHDQLDELEALQFVVGNVEHLSFLPENIDYIVHGASCTASKDFVDRPVETIETAVTGTKNLLELAKTKKVLGFVYLSSMEVYGHPCKGKKLTEDQIGMLVPQDVRNSYPISKLLCENMCSAYSSEYGVHAMVIRLAQTYGPGQSNSDQRAIAEFLRCVDEKRDIVLKTKGETERSYLYTADAVTAILTVLTKGTSGAIYNAADEESYCSISQLAESLASAGGVHVRYEIQEQQNTGFLSTVYFDLDTTQLRCLGWDVLR